MELQKNKLLSELTTFGIGGPAKFFTEARTISAMQEALCWCREQKIPFIILGKGSNTLFDDRGFNGCIILNKIDFLEKNQSGLYQVGAGYSFSLLGAQTARSGWTGLEFASGIPGSVGGAVFMNAGANGRETCESLISVDYVDEHGILHLLPKRSLHFGNRTSSFQPLKGVIVGATFQLEPSTEARSQQLEIINYRKNTQPYGDKSAGCIFRNPKNGHAGALIDQCGLKGVQIGGAQVSPMHANFIVNRANAKAEDVKELVLHICKTVKEKTGFDLETEVRFIPFEDNKND